MSWGNRAEGKSENQGGCSKVMHPPPLVEIGLTDNLPKTGRGGGPGPLTPTALGKYWVVMTYELSVKCAYLCSRLNSSVHTGPIIHYVICSLNFYGHPTCNHLNSPSSM